MHFAGVAFWRQRVLASITFGATWLRCAFLFDVAVEVRFIFWLPNWLRWSSVNVRRSLAQIIVQNSPPIYGLISLGHALQLGN